MPRGKKEIKLPEVDLHDAFKVYDKELTVLAQKNRLEPTLAESILWTSILRKRQLLGYKFLRQKPMACFVLDFYCSELLLAIEIDGSSHDDKKCYDEERTKNLQSMDIKVIRYSNNEVLHHLDKMRIDLIEQIKIREKDRIIKVRKQNSPLTRGDVRRTEGFGINS